MRATKALLGADPAFLFLPEVARCVRSLLTVQLPPVPGSRGERTVLQLPYDLRAFCALGISIRTTMPQPFLRRIPPASPLDSSRHTQFTSNPVTGAGRAMDREHGFIAGVAGDKSGRSCIDRSRLPAGYRASLIG